MGRASKREAQPAFDAIVITPNGNLLNDGLNSYTWNSRDQLIAVAGPVAAGFQYSRFAPLELPRWRESDDLRRFLVALERTLPLREASHLAERDSVSLLLAASDGITGQLTELVMHAARHALQIAQERISPPLLQGLLRAEGMLAA